MEFKQTNEIRKKIPSLRIVIATQWAMRDTRASNKKLRTSSRIVLTFQVITTVQLEDLGQVPTLLRPAVFSSLQWV